MLSPWAPTPKFHGQAVLTVALKDEPFLGSLTDGQLGRALGTLSALHDFLAQLVVAEGSGVLR